MVFLVFDFKLEYFLTWETNAFTYLDKLDGKKNGNIVEKKFCEIGPIVKHTYLDVCYNN